MSIRIPHSNRAGRSEIAAVIVGALALVIGSAVIGVVVNQVSPRGIPLLSTTADADSSATPALPKGIRGVDLPEALSAFDEDAALFLDARSPEDYAEGHVPGALSLPAYEFDAQFPEIADRVEEAQSIIVYCDGVECSDSIHVAERLVEYGFPDVSVFESGWRAWAESGAPVSEGVEP
ncbi:MAG: rhodanese-like domain-containing protein [Armatimonadetes bacterium]|nr:rhodanese-like domain-containing protein [Armatimonadota bacterium]